TAEAVGIDLRTNGVDSFDAGYNANLVGRLLSALIDTGTVLLVYLLGRDLFDRKVGFVAAILLTFTVLHIQYAHFFGAEPWVAFFVTAGVWLSLRLARGDLRTRVAAGTGLLLGIAMASKLIAVAALIVPAIAVLVAIAPAMNAGARQVWRTYRPHARANPGLATAVGVAFLALIGSAVFWLPELLVAAVIVGTLAVVVTSLSVIRRAEHSHPTTRILYDQEADPPSIAIRPQRTRPSWHVVVWGAFTGIVVLAATAVTYRVLQPYTFDGLVSIDDRFTRDIDYLSGVNSGGNVPWVVQWIGRTPLLFPLKSAFLWGMGPALGLAVGLGIWQAIRDVITRQRWILLVPLGLLAVMIGLVSQQFNPLIRYLQPAYPVAVVLGAFGVVGLWNAGRAALAGDSPRRRATGRVLQVAAGSIIVLTAFWGLAFVNGVYNTDHPRIQASVWMAQNLPPNSVLSNQIWDDALPLQVPGTEAASFTLVAFDPFQPDAAVNGETQQGKTAQLIANLDRVDYVVEASNRLYDSIPRIPAKYPATTAYYETLFDGRLGFEQIAEFRNSPSLFGIDIPDHFAEETFTIYDHPTVTIWAKTDRFSVGRAEALLNPAKASIAPDLVPNQAATNALLLRPDDAVALATGETFNETFTTNGPTATLTWVWWLMWLQLAALAVLPWTTLLFKSLPDKGYGLTKILGLLTVGLAVWLTVSWDVAGYGRNLIWIWFALVGAVGLVLWSLHRERMADLMRSQRRAWVTTELVFMVVFALAVWMRSANPDLWEAHLGGEKPMELAYLTSIGRTRSFPPADPWFAGGFMNYYYFGWYLLTLPMRALRIPPGVAFNLGVATYAAMTASVAFSIVHNLVAVSRQRWARAVEAGRARLPQKSSWAPVSAGIVSVVLLLGIGNLDAIRLHYARLRAVNRWDLATDIPVVGQVVTFAGGTWAWMNGASLGRFDWWQPSRLNRG
ncbi:MAG: DUF2298 domain-containing protein, partial [Acidimicrobiales bacterium]